jgi:predicted ribosome quality control (RQC) complex YloA/Tae2 family protein
MQNNFYFLRQVSESLKNKIIGYKAYSCFSQTKSELILQLERAGNVFNIRINTSPDLSCVSFPSNFSRSKKNNIDLFGEIIGRTVTDVLQFENDRSFALTFDGLTFAILLHGVRANVILFEGEDPKVFFNKKLSRGFNLKMTHLNRKLDLSYNAFAANHFQIKKTIPTFDATIQQYLESINFKERQETEKWELVQEVLSILETPVSYYITENNKKIILSLLEVGEVKKIFADPLEAANGFFEHFTYNNLFTRTKENLIGEYQKAIIRTKSFLAKTKEKLASLNQSNLYEEYANILMANLQQVSPGAREAVLFNFYNNREIIIPLKETLSPQKNAENYYKKAKNKKYEISNLESVIAGKELFLNTLQKEFVQLQEVSGLKDLKSFTKRQETQKTVDDEEESVPYRRVIFDGYEILVGKSAKSNDELLQKYTYKDDLWLHAKDVTGSHVILKYKSGSNFPAYVIERAAEIAAFNSKRKTDSHCPVTYTHRKFVRKQKGLAPGAVIVEKEKVLIVTPKGF